MKILQASAEAAPFAKVGGLADMTGALPKAWAEAGHDVLAVLPLYGTIDREKYGLERLDLELAVPLGHWVEYADVYATSESRNGRFYFIHSHEYFDRRGIYGYSDGFQDNDRRFIFLCRAAFELAKALDFRPDVVHAHDYHTAPMMPMLKIHYRHDPFYSQTAGVYTIHNMAYQGLYEPQKAMSYCGFNPTDFYAGSWFEHHGLFNAMKAGIMFADKITTVSPTYAEEIRWTPEGMGMQPALQSKGADVLGVLNGIDPSIWSPMADEHIPLPYDATSIGKKEADKRALLMELGLSLEEASQPIPLVGMVSRLTEQKGVGIVPEALEPFVAQGRLRFVILGSGEERFEQSFYALAARYPKRVLVGTGYNEPFSHRIQAGSDFYLMPSKFEPCGLTQMFALAYGTVPIVRAVGGLNDTVQEYDALTRQGTGFRFHLLTVPALSEAIDRALRHYGIEPHWSAIRANAMAQDNSIVRTAASYIDVFTWALEKIRR
jgi:starch synthase